MLFPAPEFPIKPIFFPELINIDSLVSPDLPKALIGYAESMKNPQIWIQLVTNYWNKNNIKPPNTLLPILERTFARSFEVAPLISQNLQLHKEQRIRLTDNQMKLLDYIKNRRRAAISGGAGTGKTVLAVEKAKRLSKEGFKTLLTCYNKQLGMHLERVCKDIENL